MAKFSIILPSYLEKYKHSASNPEAKLKRAIESALSQEDFELIVMSDGCDKTIDIVMEHFWGEKGLRLFKLDKDRELRGSKRNAGASGVVRNAGLQQAKGEYVIYLDHDDMYRKDYLKDLALLLDDSDWYWFDDLSFNTRTNKFDRKICDIDKQGQCGTSNLCHKRSMNAWWSDSVHYLHDWFFISTLKAISSKYKRLDIAGYQVCHVPHLLDI